MCNMNRPKIPFRIRAKSVHDKDKAVQCDLCELWIHIKCNKLNYLDYRYLQNCDESWYCIECCSTIFPFNSLSSNKKFLACCTNTDSNIIQWKDLENDHASSLSLKLSSNLELLVNHFSNATPENSDDREKIIFSHKNLTIINHYPCSIETHVLLIKILMTFNISWVALKQSLT